MDDAKGKVESPVIGISLNAQFSAGRTVVFQTHVPQDVTAEGVAAILQKLNGVADQEEAFYAQEQARRSVEVEERATASMQRRLEEVDAGKQNADPRKRNTPVSEKDVRERKQVLDTLEEGKRRVREAKKFLAELIEKAGNRDGASSPANH